MRCTKYANLYILLENCSLNICSYCVKYFKWEYINKTAAKLIIAISWYMHMWFNISVGVAREPYLSFGQRQLLAQNEQMRTPCLYLCPQFAETHPRMKSLIADMTCLDAKNRTKLQRVQSEIDQVGQSNIYIARNCLAIRQWQYHWWNSKCIMKNTKLY